MQRVSHKAVVCGVAAIGVLLAGVGLVLFSHREIPSPSGWSSRYRQFYNPFTGYIRVRDNVKGDTLFYYYDDQDVRPVDLTETNDGGWVVVFRPRKP